MARSVGKWYGLSQISTYRKAWLSRKTKRWHYYREYKEPSPDDGKENASMVRIENGNDRSGNLFGPPGRDDALLHPRPFTSIPQHWHNYSWGAICNFPMDSYNMFHSFTFVVSLWNLTTRDGGIHPSLSFYLGIPIPSSTHPSPSPNLTQYSPSPYQ